MKPEHLAIVDDLQKNVIPTWTDDEKNYFFSSEWNGESLIQFHFTVGRFIRNHYDLWKIPHTPEIIHGIDHSPDHPDAISMQIIKELWKRGLEKEENK